MTAKLAAEWRYFTIFVVRMSTTKAHVITLVCVCIFAFFVNNGTIYTDIMESRNIVSAREMVYDGHWIVPTMNGELRIEKPPLPTWIAAGVEEVLPDNVPAQRAMAGLAAVMLVLVFYFLVRDIAKSSGTALMSALVLCTCYNIILMGRTASWDIFCHAFMVVALYLLYKALLLDGRQWLRFTLAGLFMGLSFMSKGPVSFYAVLLPFIISYLIWLRCPAQHKLMPILVMVVLCLVVSGWWYVMLLTIYKAQADYVINKESSSWVNRNVRPWYYYGLFFLETGVWALLTLTTLLVPWWKKWISDNKAYFFSVTWMLLTVVLLSFLPEKKNRYLLPMLIPASFAMGTIINHWVESFKNDTAVRADRIIYKVNALLIAIVTFILPVAAYIFLWRKGLISMPALITLSVAIWVIVAVMAHSVFKSRPRLLVVSVVVLFVFAEVFCMPFVGDLVNNPEYKSVKLTRLDKRLDKLPFYSVKGEELRIEIVYEAGRKIRPLDISDSAAVMRAMPFAILTHERVGKELPRSILNQLDTVFVGRFDNNRRPKGGRFYNDKFVYNVTILKEK